MSDALLMIFTSSQRETLSNISEIKSNFLTNLFFKTKQVRDQEILKKIKEKNVTSSKLKQPTLSPLVFRTQLG